MVVYRSTKLALYHVCAALSRDSKLIISTTPLQYDYPPKMPECFPDIEIIY
jgi:hypothetical protein